MITVTRIRTYSNLHESTDWVWKLNCTGVVVCCNWNALVHSERSIGRSGATKKMRFFFSNDHHSSAVNLLYHLPKV